MNAFPDIDLNIKNPTKQKKSLMIATPCHNGKVDSFYVTSLVGSIDLLKQNNIEVGVLLPPTGSILPKERNLIVQAFMDSPCTHLLMIDSDIGWDPQAPLRLLSHNKDIIMGVYPARTNLDVKRFLFTPKLNEIGGVENDGKLLKLEAGPAGFMLVSRDAIEVMQNHHKDLKFNTPSFSGDNQKGYMFFDFELKDEQVWGEDYVFCRRAREAGLTIWCDASIMFNHAGMIGKLEEILTNNPTQAQAYHNQKEFKYVSGK